MPVPQHRLQKRKPLFKNSLVQKEKWEEKSTGIIILAAGSSSRLGRPKQLLQYRGKTLLQHTVETALASTADTVVVVVGAASEKLSAAFSHREVQMVVNTAWQEGMASSIRCGLAALTAHSPMLDGLIIMVCDQPFVTPALLNSLLQAHRQTGKPVVACSYDNTFGPPVFFHHLLFNELRGLTGDKGASSIVKGHAEDVALVPFPEGRFDVDTEADYEKLNRGNT